MLFAILGLFGFLAIAFFIIYNGLIARKNRVEEAIGGLDAQLKKRYDLIPNLVATVQQFMQHEKGLLTELTALRSEAARTDLGMEEKAELDQRINRAMQQFRVTVENYPDIKSGANFMHLQATLNEVEAQIAAARRNYNAAVREYNNGREMFPSNLVAGMMNYPPRQMFEATETERQNVDVKNLFKS